MEGNKKNKPRGILVFGAPCSGKTTFAEKFAAKYGLAYYNIDELTKEYDLNRQAILLILELILRTKQSIVIEGGLDSENERTEIRNVFRNNGYNPALIWVQTDIATIRMRLKKRYRSVAKAKQFYDEAIAVIEAPTEFEHPIILSGKHTFETQNKHAIAGLADLIEAK